MYDLERFDDEDLIDHLVGRGYHVIGPVGPVLVDCGCTVTVYGDGSGVELHYCPTHAASPALLAACRAEQTVRNLLAEEQNAAVENLDAVIRHSVMPNNMAAFRERTEKARQDADRLRQIALAPITQGTGRDG